MGSSHVWKVSQFTFKKCNAVNYRRLEWDLLADVPEIFSDLKLSAELRAWKKVFESISSCQRTKEKNQDFTMF